MGVRSLRLDYIDIAGLERRKSRQRGRLLREFRRMIEESYWDEDLLKYAKWADGLSLSVSILSALCLLSLCLSLGP